MNEKHYYRMITTLLKHDINYDMGNGRSISCNCNCRYAISTAE